MKPLLNETDDALEQALLREARDYKASPKTRARALAIVGLGKTSWLKSVGLKVALGVAAAGAIVGAWWHVRTPPTDVGPADRPTLAAETTVPLQAAAQATISATAPAAFATSAAPMAVGPVKAVAPTQSVKSTLSEEIAAIDRARDAVYAKNREAAIRALDEYDRRFPKGSLAPEAKTLRARAEALP